MFRALFLYILLAATSSYAYKGHHLVATPAGTPCDYQTGHGFVFFSPNYDSNCDSFFIYHLAELECPHQYIVVAEVSPDPALKAAYCKQIQTGNETTYGVAPEFILPQFMRGQITTFTSQFFQGFFTTVLLDSVTVNLKNIVYAQMINIIQPGSLGYFLYEDSEDNRFMSHAITTAPDFDQLLLVDVQADNPDDAPNGRKGPVYVSFNVPNTYANRLKEGQDYTGMMYAVIYDGQLSPREIKIHIRKNIYPGPNKLNGDGQTDFQRFCAEKDRPVWDSCRILTGV